ncbi:MAG: hypothetical protein ACO4CS_18750 [bacterium]
MIHLEIGDQVYARFFGDEILTIKALARKPLSHRTCVVKGKTYGIPDFPHYVCSSRGSDYVIPKLHLSTKRLSPETGTSNRRQLSLPA